MCILSVYALLKVVSYYDLSVLSVWVIGFKKKVWMGGWDVLYPILFWIFNFDAKPLRQLMETWIHSEIVYCCKRLQTIIFQQTNI